MTTVVDSIEQAVTGGGGWKEQLGRVGLAGRGVLYVVLGVLTVQLASGDAGADTDTDGALEWIADQPLGRFLLVALTVALLALGVWRLLDAAVGDPVEGSDARKRIEFLLRAGVYLSIAYVAASTTIAHWGRGGSGGGGSGEKEQKATATVLEWPGGRWLVVAGGMAVAGWAVHLFRNHAVDLDFLERLRIGRDSWIAALGRVGYGVRSAVFVLVAWFLVQAGIAYEPDKSKGLSGALQELAGEPWGRVLLWFVAVGLVAFGAFNLAEARYRRAA